MSSRIHSFKFLCACLSVSSSDIDKLRTEIINDDIVWEDVITLANNNMLTPALWVSLSNKGLVEYIPLELRDYLDELHNLNTQRNEKLSTQAIEAINALNSINVKPALLKGSAYLFLNAFGDIGARMMYDLDIMISKSELEKSVNKLQQLAYETSTEEGVKFTDHHHIAPLIRQGEYGSIELHHELLSNTCSSVLPTAEAWRHTETITIEDFSVAVLSPTHRVLHSILHAQVSDAYHKHHIINLRSLHDLDNLLCNDKAEIDWNYIQKIMKTHGLRSVLLSHLYHVNILFGTALPEGIKPNLLCRLHYLRCMAGIRWDRFARFERDLKRYSRKKICRRYHCENHWIPVNKNRIIYTGELLKRWFLGVTRLLRNNN